ncbi:Molybdopterin binding protein [Aureobasidium pullulans]|nr:Molybdopterin binding protein [Aureobasidium pullulans]
MFSRLNQVARHLSRPLPNYLHQSAAAATSRLTSNPSIMAQANNKRTINTAACLIIGDEVLGGKTVDTNSAYLAKFCFSLGINLKRIEVIGDEESEIVEAVRRMSSNYDFVVTSGGIGPTHDDITYQSIANAFDLPLVLHDDTFSRMKRLSRPHPNQPNFDWNTPSPALEAKKRMVILPYDKNLSSEEQVVFTADDLWVPVAVVNGNVHILPGVPRLFERMLTGLKPGLLPRLTDPEGKGVYRIIISTPLPESGVASYLTELAKKVEPEGIKVGSYPRWGKARNTVTLVGRNKEYMDSLVPEVEKGVQGKRVTKEGEDDVDGESDKDT